jgi:signal transduction histidine kinase
VLQDEVAGPVTPMQHAYLTKMLSGADVLLNLVNDLLDMSRIQAGKFSLSPGPTDMGAVVTDAMAIMVPLAEQKGHALGAEVVGELPEIVADEQRVSQVLLNLIANAIKFTPNGGNIRVRVARDGAFVRCEVADTGDGIAESDLPRLFQRFGQLDSSNTRAATGAGLGLSISKALVEAHGGAIGVTSAPGVGSTFWFTLPIGA